MPELHIATSSEIIEASGLMHAMAKEVEQHYYGPSDFVDLFIASLIADGHILMEATPGTSKTVLAKGAAVMLGGTFGRVQGSPDIRPADITLNREPGLEPGSWQVVEGPIFNDVVLVDEGNRLTPKTQAALLEAMEERQVTGFGETRKLPVNQKLIETQNPYAIGNGTSELPDQTRDRFSFGLVMPKPEAKHKIAAWSRETKQPNFSSVITADTMGLSALRRIAQRRVRFTPELHERIIQIEKAFGQLTDNGDQLVTPGSQILVENSARPGQALSELARVMAILEENSNVEVGDIDYLAPVVYAHRIKPTHVAHDKGLSATDIVEMAVEQADHVEV